MWPFSRKPKEERSSAPILFTNTLTRRKEPFAPYKDGVVTYYACGPTVYNRAHIGNLRAYVLEDLISRVLAEAGYRIRRVINITDVGHLTGDNEGDADQGEDRMEKSAREAGGRAADIAERYTKLFLEDIRALNLPTDDIYFPRATDYIDEQIAFIQKLEDKGLTYRIDDGIYFDTSRFPDYGKLGGVPEALIKDGDADSLADRVALAGRARIKENAEKRSPADFALWKFSPAGVVRQQEWSSPWGRGFPGWHIECSAMAKALLGETIDIHSGGMDHIPVHHNNEIAQSEAANGKLLARYWLHGAFLTMGADRIGKSVGNALYISDLTERGIHPLALRYLFLQAHYRSPLSFSWEALTASNEALNRLWRIAREVKDASKGIAAHTPAIDRITALVRDDLSTAQALAVLWETVKDDSLSSKAVWGTLVAADKLLGLSLTNPPAPLGAVSFEELPEDVRKLVGEREAARKAKDYAKADEIRVHIAERGYLVEDAEGGPVVTIK
jgi:cysteinyl-tRNA synthetase